MRETRTPRLTWRGLETWHGRDTVTLADERASNGEHKLRPTPARQSSTLPMSGDWKRSYGAASGAPRTERRGNRDATPIATVPVVDSTVSCDLRQQMCGPKAVVGDLAPVGSFDFVAAAEMRPPDQSSQHEILLPLAPKVTPP